MRTRFALLEGSLKPGQTDAFRAAVGEQTLPLWIQFLCGSVVYFGQA